MQSQQFHILSFSTNKVQFFKKWDWNLHVRSVSQKGPDMIAKLQITTKGKSYTLCFSVWRCETFSWKHRNHLLLPTKKLQANCKNMGLGSGKDGSEDPSVGLDRTPFVFNNLTQKISKNKCLDSYKSKIQKQHHKKADKHLHTLVQDGQTVQWVDMSGQSCHSTHILDDRSNRLYPHSQQSHWVGLWFHARKYGQHCRTLLKQTKWPACTCFFLCGNSWSLVWCAAHPKSWTALWAVAVVWRDIKTALLSRKKTTWCNTVHQDAEGRKANWSHFHLPFDVVALAVVELSDAMDCV